VRLLLAQIDHSLRGEKLRGTTDPDFEAAKQEFQRLYSISTLLAAHTTSEKRVTSSFHGVVLE
jgi:hypothetical protein